MSSTWPAPATRRPACTHNSYVVSGFSRTVERFEMISQYVASALERAHYRSIDNGTFAATVRGLKGVVATGTSLEACRRDLVEVIEEWVLVRVARGLPAGLARRSIAKAGANPESSRQIRVG